MHQVSKTLKFLYLTVTFVFCLFLTTPNQADALECDIEFNNLSTYAIGNKEIESEIQSYLLNNPCAPLLTDSRAQFKIVKIFQESGVTYVAGTLSQENNEFLALFSIDKGWIWTTTQLLFLSTDLPPSVQLFRDIQYGARQALPSSLSNYHLFIQREPISSQTDPTRVQKWTYYNQNEWVELLVVIAPTPDGGADFAILQLNEE